MKESTEPSILKNLVCCCGKPATRARVTEKDVGSTTIDDNKGTQIKLKTYSTQPYGWACDNHWYPTQPNQISKFPYTQGE